MVEQLTFDLRAAPAVHAHVLAGCRPRPLASYLKAVGVLRMVAEQADPEARGFWRDDSFVLLTRLDEAALLRFFLHTWQPSPFMSPWNKGSGLLTERDKGVAPLLASTAPRFAQVRAGIEATRELTRAMKGAVEAEKAIKAEKTKLRGAEAKEALAANPDYQARLRQAAKACKQLKDELQPECQRRWRGPTLRWLRAALVVTADGGARFPAMLGTGGNDGKLDFTNNAMQRLADLFDLKSEDGGPKPLAGAALRSALFGDADQVLIKGGIGQFSPGQSGGANASAGALADSKLNPWDLPFLLEGALLFAAGTSRRLGGVASEQTVAPFSVRAGAAGYASASLTDESPRGEQWLPLWTRPWSASEVEALLREGRSQLGSRPSETALDAARAVARLGVARGVTAFERYGYLERNGKSNYAVPLGRWQVRAAPHASLLDDLDSGSWWSRFRRAVRGERAPATLVVLERRLADTVMGALAHGDEPLRFQAILLTLAEIDAQLVASGAFTASNGLQPTPKLSSQWVAAANDGGSELALALSLAGAGAGHDKTGRPVDGVRSHWMPLDKFGRFEKRERALAKSPRVVMHGRDAEADLIRLVMRRLGESASGASRTLALRPRPGTAATLSDLARLLSGSVDLERTLWLGRALSALDWSTWQPRERQKRATTDLAVASLDPAYLALRLCHLADSLTDGRRIPVDPAVTRQLAAGDASRAFTLVIARLRGVGIRLPFQAIGMAPDRARRMAASLAFPISLHATRNIVRALDPANAPMAQEVRDVD